MITSFEYTKIATSENSSSKKCAHIFTKNSNFYKPAQKYIIEKLPSTKTTNYDILEHKITN